MMNFLIDGNLKKQNNKEEWPFATSLSRKQQIGI